MTWFNVLKGEGAKDEVTRAKLEDWVARHRPEIAANYNLPETIRGMKYWSQEQMDWVMNEFYSDTKNSGKNIKEHSKAYRELNEIRDSIRWLDREGEDMRYVRPWEWRL